MKNLMDQFAIVCVKIQDQFLFAIFYKRNVFLQIEYFAAIESSRTEQSIFYWNIQFTIYYNFVICMNVQYM